MDDLANVLAIEIKQEIAGRYFGFRKKIEIQIGNYLDILKTCRAGQLELLDTIGRNLFTIRAILKDPNLFSDFIKIAGLPEQFCSFENIVNIPIPFQEKTHSLLCKIKGPRFASRLRLNKLMQKQYQELYNHVEHYLKVQNELVEMHEEINDNIKIFYRNNDIGAILDFLRQIDHPDSPQNNSTQTLHSRASKQSLEAEMQIKLPPAVETQIPIFRRLLPISAVKSKAKILLENALQ